MKRSGFADLPLHSGHVPQWLAERMTKLGAAIAEIVVREYGASAFLSRLSDPFWFQAFGAVMGMDWHSSGITTSVMGALKRGLAPSADELGVYVCGGRGRFSRNTPQELLNVAERRGLDGERWYAQAGLQRASTTMRSPTAFRFTSTVSSSRRTASGRSSSKA